MITVAMIAGVGYYLGIQQGPQTQDLSQNPRPSADFILPDLQGKPIHLSDFKGKVILLDFWATWCLPCIEELPDLKAVYKKYADKGFVIVGVSLDEAGKEVVVQFVKEHNVPWPVLFAGGADKSPKGYPLRGLPTAYLISPDGMIRKRYTGFKFREELEKDIESLVPIRKGGG